MPAAASPLAALNGLTITMSADPAMKAAIDRPIPIPDVGKGREPYDIRKARWEAHHAAAAADHADRQPRRWHRNRPALCDPHGLPDAAELVDGRAGWRIWLWGYPPGWRWALKGPRQAAADGRAPDRETALQAAKDKAKTMWRGGYR